MLHEVLHAALLHVVRRGPARDKVLWNIACDIVVNGMIFAEAGRSDKNSAWKLSLPEGHVREPELENYSVEEVYEIIQADDKYQHLRDIADAWRDLIEGVGDVDDPAAHRAALEAHWRAAHAQAQTTMRLSGKGDIPAELARELANLDPAQVDWRSRLWRYLVRTPTDFSGFDRRFLGRGLYLEALEGETLRVYVGIDTSGSIGDKQLAQFLGEVQGILRAYPHIGCYLFYVDAAAHGPYHLTADTDTSSFPRPVGGGGTDFRPFFAAVEKTIDETADYHSAFGQTETLCVYLTDGFGTFPDPAPKRETLWVVTAGGLDLKDFPFGETARLV
jgi:predicted metal-dependent peptidase